MGNETGESGNRGQRTSGSHPATNANATASSSGIHTSAVGGIVVNGHQVCDDDGWRAREFEGAAHPHLAVWLELKVGGELLPPHARRLWHSHVSPKTRGEMSRWRCLGEAIARFLNTGGTLAEIEASLRSLDKDVPAIQFPGYFLLSTEQEMELDSPTHIFVKADENSDRLLVWTEGVSLEVSTLTAENEYREG